MRRKKWLSFFELLGSISPLSRVQFFSSPRDDVGGFIWQKAACNLKRVHVETGKEKKKKKPKLLLVKFT